VFPPLTATIVVRSMTACAKAYKFWGLSGEVEEPVPDGSAGLFEGADGTGCADELNLADADAATDAADDECVSTVDDFVVDVVVGGGVWVVVGVVWVAVVCSVVLVVWCVVVFLVVVWASSSPPPPPPDEPSTKLQSP